MNSEPASSYDDRRQYEQLSREAINLYQLKRFHALVEKILPHNRFYSEKFASSSFPLENFEAFTHLPFTYKENLLSNTHSEGENYAANLTYPIERYTRFHRTSGTRGRPLVVLDTDDDWLWWLEAWQYVLDSAEIGPEDRALMAFSFGPFVGFWSAHEALLRRGALSIPAGGLSTLARLELIRSSNATVLCATPSYALHLAEVALAHQMDVCTFSIQRIIVAGEPGGSIPEIKNKIESVWNARVVDHSGASEIGPWGYADPNGSGLYINESEFIPEFFSLRTGKPAHEGELSELVLTTLGREGCPIIRYKTGDLVKPHWNRTSTNGKTNNFVFLEGGVLGRADDMMIIRGVNIFPSSVEQILRSFPELIEYRMTAFKEGHLDQLKIEIEDRLEQPERVAKELQVRLGLKIDVSLVPPNTLPRFELKGQRFIDERR
ncbi:MAG: phenylacetate--CoA ligase family protein [Pirellulaceae bacterium]|nr:phenylacetate--CoA ligase family protein [Pirellulaceae bacterium]